MSILIKPTTYIGRPIRNLRGNLPNSAKRLFLYFYPVAPFLPS